MSSLELKADAKDPGQKLDRFWSKCVGAGRANEGLRADWQDQLRLAVKECGFKYVRFHGLYHDDMFVYREVNGRAIHNFQYVDILCDKLLEIGIKPFVEFGFCPKDLATETGATKQEYFIADANGSFRLQRSIEPWSVVLIREL